VSKGHTLILYSCRHTGHKARDKTEHYTQDTKQETKAKQSNSQIEKKGGSSSPSCRLESSPPEDPAEKKGGTSCCVSRETSKRREGAAGEEGTTSGAGGGATGLTILLHDGCRHRLTSPWQTPPLPLQERGRPLPLPHWRGRRERK
jgi:hypothetical protein